MRFPPAHPPQLHSTNPIKRLNGEIKRRTNVVAIFPNEAAIVRLVGALLLEQSDEWATQRARYITVETIGAVSDNTIVSLSAAPTCPAAHPANNHRSYTTRWDTILADVEVDDNA
jgi:hypothetical protein